MVICISDKKLKGFIRESIQEALKTEFMRVRALALPEVSRQEQKDIEKRYGKPSRRGGRSYSL